MSTNISKQKRDALLDKINQIKNYISAAPQDENTANLLTYIGELTKEINGKKYGLVFEEHREKIDELLEENAPVLVEQKDLFIDNGGKMNFLIEGDNLAALKLLEKTHKGKIDVIYIDPPYNTGKEDFIYDDNYIDEEDGFNHSKWGTFITKRLNIASRLLSENGIIFISIDDNEYAPLKMICDEIFGERNRLITNHIQVRYDNKQTRDIQFLPVMEYVLVYAKNKLKFQPNLPYEQYNFDKFVYEIKENDSGKEITVGNDRVEIFKKGQWSIIKHEIGSEKFLKETWISGSIYSDISYGKIYKRIIEPRVLEDGLGCLYKIYGRGEDGLGYRYYTNPQKENATKGKTYSGVPLYRIEEIKKGDSRQYKPLINLYDFSPDFGNIRNEGGVGFNSGKKPVKMLKQFLNYHKDKNITVLDFFAGSASTGHAVWALNDEDSGNRKFILCTSSEKDICRTISYQRLKNVIEKDKYPASLKYFKIDYLPIKDKMYYEYADELLEHVKELVELENAIDFNSNKSVAIVLDDDELDDFVENIEDYPECKTLYMGHDVLTSYQQEQTIKAHGITINTVPDYYYRDLAN